MWELCINSILVWREAIVQNMRTGGVDVTERPILFSGPMVRAILDGSKTQTRRVVKPQPIPSASLHFDVIADHIYANGIVADCKDFPIPIRFYIGDRLWVRETFSDRGDNNAAYRATGDVRCEDEYVKLQDMGVVWKPSIFMPRWASRITLEITDVRVDKLVTINHVDATKEGFDSLEDFKSAWNKLHQRKEGFLWQSNPWVWVLEFRKV